MKDLIYYYDFIIINRITTKEAIDLVICINGWKLETFNNILYAKTGYRSLEQYKECEVFCYE